MTLVENVAKILLTNNLTLSTAESCTGGLLSNNLTNIPNSSHFFKAGLIPYSNESKTNLLNIPSNILKVKGAVSKEVAILMARNIRKKIQTDFGLALTGIAGPNGGTKEKPTGLVFIALSHKTQESCHQYQFKGNRISIKNQATQESLTLLLKSLKEILTTT